MYKEKKGTIHEEDFSTQCSKKKKTSRFQIKDVNSQRQKDSIKKASKRKKKTFGIMTKIIVSLKNRKEFLLLRKNSVKTLSKYLIIYKQQFSCKKNISIGLTVSKKNGNAVIRNRIRRLIKAVVYNNKDKIPRGLSIEIIPKNSFLDCNYKSLKEDFLKNCFISHKSVL